MSTRPVCGVKITEEAASSLGRIVDRTDKVGDLTVGIAAASNKQAQGIMQIVGDAITL